MIISAVEQYLHLLAERASALEPGFVQNPEERLSLDELMQADFRRRSADAFADLDAKIHALENLEHRIMCVTAQHWLRRWLDRSRLRALSREHSRLQGEVTQSRNVLTVSERKYMGDPTLFARAHLYYENLGHHRAQRLQFEQLRKLIADLSHQILQFQLLYGRVGISLEFSHPAPAFNGPDDVPRVIAFLENFAPTLPSLMERLSIELAGSNDAKLILTRWTLSPIVGATPPGEFASRAANALYSLLKPTEEERSHWRYEELLLAAIRPTALTRLEAWLVFWTTAEATRRLALAFLHNPLQPNFLLEWCQAWRAQREHWSFATLQHYAPGHDVMPCTLLRRHDHVSGDGTGDALFVLNVAGPARNYCSVAGIHFADPAQFEDNNASIAEDPPYSTTATLHRKGGGRWRGIAAFARPNWAGVPTFPAFEFMQAPPLTMRKMSNQAPWATRVHPNANETEQGEPLETALAQCLTACNGNAFETVHDAFNWLDEAVGVTLPAFVMVLSIGRSNEPAHAAVARLQRLAHRQGVHYDICSDEVRTTTNITTCNAKE